MRSLCLALVAILLLTNSARADESARARRMIVVGSVFLAVGGLAMTAIGGVATDLFVKQPNGDFGATGGLMFGVPAIIAGGFIAGGISLLAVGAHRYAKIRRDTLTVGPTTLALSF